MSSLSDKLENAIKERAKHVVAFLGYEASLATAGTILTWRQEVLNWEKAPHAKGTVNPFAPTFRGLTFLCQLLLC